MFTFFIFYLLFEVFVDYLDLKLCFYFNRFQYPTMDQLAGMLPTVVEHFGLVFFILNRHHYQYVLNL